jgi:hypothetical protein
MSYGKEELLYAEPFADALVNDAGFRSWVLGQTKFAEFAYDARLLNREMQIQRSVGARYWWRSHYTEACRCFGCSGQETDLLAIFEIASGLRFALHMEVKHPGDKFKDTGNQAAAYPVRALCWATEGKTPAKVLPHSLATTALLFSALKRTEYASHLRHFDTLITIEDVEKNFPKAAARRG